MKKTMGFAFIIALALLLPLNVVAVNLLERAELRIRANIPVAQEMIIVDPVVLNIDYPWEGALDGEPLIATGVGKINIHSNANWTLNIEAINAQGFQVWLKPAFDSFARWQKVDGIRGYTGVIGSYEYSWDLKLETVGAVLPGNKTFQLVFTLSDI